MDTSSAELPLDTSRDIALRIREELARRRMSRQHLADLARISLSTLEKALNGSRPLTLATVIRLETALDMSLRGRNGEPEPALTAGAAPVELGAYTRDAVRWLEGDYLTLRPSFGSADAVYAYRTVIAWDPSTDCLGFHEYDRTDAPFAQKGVVSVPNKSGHVYLHTNDDGQFRLAILGRPLIGGEMYGLLASLKAGPGTHLTPVSVPLALLPFNGTEPAFGRVTPDSPDHAAYRAHLDRITGDGFALFLP